MAVTVISRPTDLGSAYVPVEYTFSSTFAGVSSTISNIKESSGFFGGGGGFTTIVTPLNKVRRNIKVDGIMTITNTTSGLYDGEFKVTQVKNNGEVTLDTPFLGNVSGGNFTYDRLNAQVVCDLYIDGSQVTRLTRRPNEVDQFVFNFQKWIEVDLDSVPLSVGMEDVTLQPTSSLSIYVKYADSEDLIIDGIPTPTLNLDTTQSPPDLFTDIANLRTIINATVPYLEWELGSVKNAIINKDTGLSSFIVDTVADNRFLTNSPKTIKIGRTDSYQLTFIVDFDAGKAYRRQIVTYDSTGAVIQTFRKTFTPIADGVWSMGAGARNFTAPTITSSVVKYEISITDANDSNNDISEVVTFEIDDNCYRSDTRFLWLNPRGGYDTFTFHSPRKLNSTVKKTTFKPARTFPVVVGNSEEKITDVDASETITTGTHKVNKETAEWLQELLESPEVFIELSSDNALHDTRVPVTLVNKTRAICDSFKGLFNVNVRYKFGFRKIPLRAV